MKLPDIALTQELEAHEAAYWREVDNNYGAEAHTFYVEKDAFFELGGKPLRSRQAIQEFYQWRRKRAERTSRHVVTNFFAEYLDAGKQTARLECILLLYAADGVPVLPSRAAVAIADVINIYERNPGGGWLLRSRELKNLFASGDPVTVPPDPT